MCSRLLWSRSLHATGELFLALKRNHEEPDATAAALTGLPPEAAAAALAGAAPAGVGTSAAAGTTGAIVPVTGEQQPPKVWSLDQLL